MNSNSVIIENASLRKTLILERNFIVSSEIFNKISSAHLVAKQKSEEFILCFKAGLFSKLIKASDLKVELCENTPSDSGYTYTIIFKPCRLWDSKLSVRLIYNVRNDNPVIRKHIELSFDKRGDKAIILDYIDFESIHFDETLNHWSIPKQADSHVPGYALEMGQPLYVDSLFFGAEFPACLNKIEKGVTSICYYSGKKLTDIMKNNLFVSCDAVVGGADGNTFPQVQRAFFDYIKTISKPIKLRRQYNSWYDHMLNITRENV
ncbi:MAG: hypothetical protein J6V06_08690, partial [Clostridia bacterium]|nr:hypothetical protein [Clostridia bacterium]